MMEIVRRRSRTRLMLFAAGAIAWGLPARAADFYVEAGEPHCSDAGAGTVLSPYCTISAALAAHHDPGTTIRVMPGVYREQVTLPASGQSGKPITLVAESGPETSVVIDGADDFSDPAQWTLSSGTTWLAAAATWGPAQVLVDGVRLTPSSAPPDSLPSGAFLAGPAGVYVNLGGPSPGTRATEIGHRRYGFYVSGKSWVSIANFTVTGCDDRGIMILNGCTNLEVTGNTVQLAAHAGIQADRSSALHLGGNTISDDGEHGISITGGSTGCAIDGNECSRNSYPSLNKGDGLYVYAATNNRIASNHLHHNAKAGETLEGGAAGNLSVQNLSWMNAGAGYNHLAAVSNVHNGDVAFGNVGDGFAMNDSSFTTSLFNCISVVNGLKHSRYDLEVDSTSTAGFASDDNVFWNPSGTEIIRYAGVPYLTLAPYAAASGQDQRTLQSDPRFLDPAGGDFRLLPGSPAIDCANSATPGWSAADAAGRPRIDDPSAPNAGLGPVTYADRGALEHDPLQWTPAVADTVPRLDHVIVVVMENKPYDMVRVAPYTASLIAASSSFSNSYAYQHQSQSDYYALWSAVGRGVTESICPAVGSPYDTENLGHLCESLGVSWRSYAEDLPSPGDTVCSSGLYTRRHCPWTDWSNVDSLNERPYTDLAADIAADALPRLSFVTPNLCDDTHNVCSSDSVLFGDIWLSNNLPAMIAGAGPRGLLILTWDEDDGSDGNHVLTVFASPLAKPGNVSARYINHFVVNRTICAALGLPPFAEAAAVDPVTDVWIGESGASPRAPPAPLIPISLSLVGPNPFRSAVTATLRLPSAQPVHAAIYDLAGRRVKSLVEGVRSGVVQIRWDGRREDGHGTAAGIYVLRVRAGGANFERKLALLESAR